MFNYLNDDYIRHYNARLDLTIYHHKDFIPQFDSQVSVMGLSFLKYDGSQFMFHASMADIDARSTFEAGFKKLFQRRRAALPGADVERMITNRGGYEVMYILTWRENDIHFREIGALHRGLNKKMVMACPAPAMAQSAHELLETGESFIYDILHGNRGLD